MNSECGIPHFPNPFNLDLTPKFPPRTRWKVGFISKFLARQRAGLSRIFGDFRGPEEKASGLQSGDPYLCLRVPGKSVISSGLSDLAPAGLCG
jgi:hypothetical protein